MTRLTLIICIYVLFNAFECKAKESVTHRFVHIKIASEESGQTIISCNGLQVPQLLLNRLFKDILKQSTEGDLIVVSSTATTEFKSLEEQIKGAVPAFRKKHVALRFVSGKQTLRHVFWWVTPHDNPNDSSSVEYFWGQLSLGKGDDGFSLFLQIMSSLKTDTVHFSLAEYRALSFSNREVPYSQRIDELTHVMKSTGIKYRQLKPVPEGL